MENQINDSLAWLLKIAETMRFGSAGIRIIIHDGQIKEITREVQERVR
jgi:hypothetical protein